MNNTSVTDAEAIAFLSLFGDGSHSADEVEDTRRALEQFIQNRQPSSEAVKLPEPYRPAVFATAQNTDSVRKGFEMGGYEKIPALFTADQMDAHYLKGRADEAAAIKAAHPKNNP